MSSVYDILLKTTVISSGLILVILCIKHIMANKLSLKWHYSIWFLLVIKLMIPINVPSSLSVYNLVDTHEESYTIEDSMQNTMKSMFMADNQMQLDDMIAEQEQPQGEKLYNNQVYHETNLDKPMLLIDSLMNISIVGVLWLVGMLITSRS